MYLKITKTKATAARSSAMEAGDHSKNGASPKSHTSRRISKIALLLIMAAFTWPVWGKQIDEKAACRVATQMLSQSSETHDADTTTQVRAQVVPKKLQLVYKSSSTENSGNTNVSTRAAQKNEEVYFYIFGAANNEGFVIVAGDDCVTPVLGYSDINKFPADNMPPNLKWWLGEYARQIKFAIENDIKPTAEVKQQWAQYLGTNHNEEEE